MAMVDWIAYYVARDTNAFKPLPIEHDKKDRLQALVTAMGVYVVFIFLVSAVTLRIDPQAAAQFESTFEYVASLVANTFSATPILFGSTFLRLIVWGVLIAFVESRAFFRTFLQWAIKGAGVKFPKSPFEINGILTMVFFGVLFAVFHIVAKGITQNTSLMTTFLFGAISVGLVIQFGRWIEAAFFHIITNTIATMQQMKIGFFAPGVSGISQEGLMLMGIVLAVSWFIMFQQLPLINPQRS
jgi:hypothetical protein